jgi:hypothetical protein
MSDHSSPESGHRLAMAKAKIRVRHLTLPPSSHLCYGRDEEAMDKHVDEDRHILDREKQLRVIELSVAASEGSQPRPHRHGIEPGFSSKFWAKENDDDSIPDSEDDLDAATPALVKEGFQAGFTMDQKSRRLRPSWILHRHQTLKCVQNYKRVLFQKLPWIGPSPPQDSP